MLNCDYQDRLNKVINYDEDVRHLSPLSPILGMVLEQYLPTKSTEHLPEFRSSMELAEYHSKVCTISINDVAAVMLYLGYEIYDDFDERGPLWAMHAVKNSFK